MEDTRLDSALGGQPDHTKQVSPELDPSKLGSPGPDSAGLGSKKTDSAELDSAASQEPWHPAKRVAFRFLAIYFVLYAIPFPFSAVFGWEAVYTAMMTSWSAAVNWVGVHVFGIEGEISSVMTGSGDTTFHWVQNFVILTVAILGCGLWSALDRNRPHYRTAARWLVVGCRYYLAYTMLSYGFAKVIKTQFPTPRLERLLSTYGDSSPMGLIWTFMGFSKAYTMFSGAGEVLGGLLLFFRRTTTLGALVVIGVMANVFMINMGYDVPVKLFSFNLLMMAVVLAALDARRLANLFVFNRPFGAVDLSPHFSSRRWVGIALAVKLLFIGWITFQEVKGGLELQKEWGDARPKPELWGIYDVQSFVLDGETHPPLLTDEVRWQNLIIDYEGYLSIRGMDGSYTRYSSEINMRAGTISLAPFRDPEAKTIWTFERHTPEVLCLEGELEGRSYVVEMTHRDPNEMRLLKRGFNWINERPFNR